MKSNKKAILIVTFGTSIKKASNVFDRFDTLVKSQYEATEIRWAYTSSTIRKKLAIQGIYLDNVRNALMKLIHDGFHSIVLQSLQTIPGVEYHKIIKEVSLFKHREETKNITMTIGRPLVFSYSDLLTVTNALLSNIPDSRRPDEAVVFIGHGSKKHPAGLLYSSLCYTLKNKDPLAFMGTVQGDPNFEDVLHFCMNNRCHKVWLIPFMAVAGDHVVNDMAGDGDESLKSMLYRRGITSTVLYTGTLDNPGVSGLWLDHLSNAYSICAQVL
jgi:sirohydrochlorin cobaltochelatase